MASLGSTGGVGGQDGDDESVGGVCDESGSGDRGGEEDRTRSTTADTHGSDSSDDDSGSTDDSALDSFVGEIENG